MTNLNSVRKTNSKTIFSIERMLRKYFNKNSNQNPNKLNDNPISVVSEASDTHNLRFEASVPDFIKQRNRKLLEAYQGILHTIEKIQGWLEDEELRTRVESDFRKKSSIKATIFQCTTLFCIVSVGCDEEGQYNIIYSVDHRFKDMISPTFASIFIRRIYDFTPGEMEPFVNIGSLYEDCVSVFNKIITEEKSEPYHTIIIEDKHQL